MELLYPRLIISIVFLIILFFIILSPKMIQGIIDNRDTLNEVHQSFYRLRNVYVAYPSMENADEITAAKAQLEKTLFELNNRPFFSELQQFNEEMQRHVTNTEVKMKDFIRLEPTAENWQQTIEKYSVSAETALQGLENIIGNYTEHILLSIRLQNAFFIIVLVMCLIFIFYLDVKKRYAESNKEQMRSLSRRYMHKLEQSNKKTVFDIHDIVLQELAIVRQFIHVLRQKPGTKTAEKAWNSIDMSLDTSTKALRNIINEIQPWNAEMTTFSNSIQNIIELFSHELFITYTSDMEELPKGLWTGDEKNQLLSIIHEALANVRKHADARETVVSVYYRNNVLRITIRDNGKGFVPARIKSTFNSNHIGLFSMKERAAMVGGTLSIESKPQKGTTVSLVVKKEKINE